MFTCILLSVQFLIPDCLGQLTRRNSRELLLEQRGSISLENTTLVDEVRTQKPALGVWKVGLQEVRHVLLTQSRKLSLAAPRLVQFEHKLIQY